MADRPTIQIALTPEQQRAIAQASGKQVATLQLKLDELEPRLSPGLHLN